MRASLRSAVVVCTDSGAMAIRPAAIRPAAPRDIWRPISPATTTVAAAIRVFTRRPASTKDSSGMLRMVWNVPSINPCRYIRSDAPVSAQKNAPG